MMTSELQYLLVTNSNCQGCSQQASLGALLADLRAVAEDLGLDFGEASLEADARDQSFCPCI